MGSWFWLNVPLMVVIFGCVAGIPLWLNLTRWKDEIEERHAEIAAGAGLGRVPVQSRPAMAAGAEEIDSPVYAQVAGER